jgi:hypothetical protein
MAKTSYLDMTNKILRRIYETTITDVTAVSGKGLMITNLLNEAQEALFDEDVSWYTLYTSDTITTAAGTASYAYPTDLGHTISIVNTTSNWLITEDLTRNFESTDPDGDTTGSPTHFVIEGADYRFYPIPAGIETLTVKYYSRPVAMSVNASTTDLPQSCEGPMIQWVLGEMYRYLSKFELAAGADAKYLAYMDNAISSNNRVIDRMFRFQGNIRADSIAPPVFSSEYVYKG